MKGGWERVVEGNQPKYEYKTKEQREWDRFEEAYKEMVRNLNVSFYNRQQTAKQRQMKAMVARITKLSGQFWGNVGNRV